MKTLNRITSAFALALLSVFLALPARGQTATPSTTLCAAITTTTATSICLVSPTGIVSQTGLYVDNEYMTANPSNSQVLSGTNVIVPVVRGNRAAGSGPAPHANGAIVWIALTPGASKAPGLNGFSMGTNMREVGPCTRGNEIYLPRILPNLGVMRDCNQNATTLGGQWVNYNDFGGQKPSPTPIVALTTNGALTVTSGTYVITKAGVLADTLGAPTAGTQDGTIITVTSSTAFAHTVTATGLFADGAGHVNLATFAANAGAGFVIMAYQGKWLVISSVGVTFT